VVLRAIIVVPVVVGASVAGGSAGSGIAARARTGYPVVENSSPNYPYDTMLQCYHILVLSISFITIR
jgi:hypothetical protein